MESKNSFCRCTRKVWKKLVMHVVGLEITNVHIFHSMKHSNKLLRIRTGHEKFRLKLTEIWLAESLLNRAPPSRPLTMLQVSSKGLLRRPCHNEYTRKKFIGGNAPPAKMYCSVRKKSALYMDAGRANFPSELSTASTFIMNVFQDWTMLPHQQ